MNRDVQPTPTHRRDGALPATDREHLATVLCGAWMTVGLFMDGYFHQSLEGTTESFLTPWHGVFYAGFVASVLWLVALSTRRSGVGLDWRLGSLPPGYGGARVGIVLFGLGAVGDAAWHTALGVERGIDALLSPTHLVLFAGLVLILTAPLRAARGAGRAGPSRWMVVGAATTATALVGFFLNFAWGLGIAALARVAYDPVTEVGETQVIGGIASMLVTSAVFFGAARVVISTGQPPPGAFAVLFGVVALLVSAAFDEDAEGVVAAVLAGAVLDVLLYTAPVRHGRHGAAFAVTSGSMWLVYLGLLAALDGIEWHPEIWMGGVVLNALLAFAIAALPTAVHEPVNRSRGDA